MKQSRRFRRFLGDWFERWGWIFPVAMIIGGCALMVWGMSGCSNVGYWLIPDKQPPFTQEEKAKFNNDLYICERDARVSKGHSIEGIGWTTHGINQEWLQRCMELRGYKWVKGTRPDDYYNPPMPK